MQFISCLSEPQAKQSHVPSGLAHILQLHRCAGSWKFISMAGALLLINNTSGTVSASCLSNVRFIYFGASQLNLWTDPRSLVLLQAQNSLYADKEVLPAGETGKQFIQLRAKTVQVAVYKEQAKPQKMPAAKEQEVVYIEPWLMPQF